MLTFSDRPTTDVSTEFCRLISWTALIVAMMLYCGWPFCHEAERPLHDMDMILMEVAKFTSS